MKNTQEQLINSDFQIQDSDMKTGEEYIHGTQIYVLKFYNGEIVTLWNEAAKWTHEERRSFFQKFYKKK